MKLDLNTVLAIVLETSTQPATDDPQEVMLARLKIVGEYLASCYDYDSEKGSEWEYLFDGLPISGTPPENQQEPDGYNRLYYKKGRDNLHFILHIKDSDDGKISVLELDGKTAGVKGYCTVESAKLYPLSSMTVEQFSSSCITRRDIIAMLESQQIQFDDTIGHLKDRLTALSMRFQQVLIATDLLKQTVDD